MENRIRKVHLESLINMLTDIWNAGADFVDIESKTEEDGDMIILSVADDYLDQDMKQNFSEFIEHLPEKDETEDPSNTSSIKLSPTKFDDLV